MYQVKSNVKEHREAMEMKQSELAKAVGVSERTISSIESERGSNIRGETMLRLAKFFQVRAEALFYLVE